MTAYTKTELRTEIAENMGIKASGQALSAEDAAKIDRAVQAALEYLEDESVVIFDPQSSSSVIPAKVFHALADFVEFYCAAAFGRPRDVALREDALKRLRRVAFGGQAPTVTPIQNY